MVEVRLFATLRMGREKVLYYDPHQYSTPMDICYDLNIPMEEVAILLYNGRHSDMDIQLKSGDVLAIFPPVGGG